MVHARDAPCDATRTYANLAECASEFPGQLKAPTARNPPPIPGTFTSQTPASGACGGRHGYSHSGTPTRRIGSNESGRGDPRRRAVRHHEESGVRAPCSTSRTTASSSREARPPDDPPPSAEPGRARAGEQGVVFPRIPDRLAFEQEKPSRAPSCPTSSSNARPPATTRRSPSSKARAPTRVTRCSRAAVFAAHDPRGQPGQHRSRGLRAAQRPRGDARVVKSTGFEELDRAALAEAKRNWRLLPATRDGVADRAVASPARDLQAESAVEPAGPIAAPESSGAACSAGGSRCWHSRKPKKMLNAATGTSIHGHLDPFFSGSIIVLPTSNRLANLL